MTLCQDTHFNGGSDKCIPRFRHRSMQSQNAGMKDLMCRLNFWRISLRWVGHTYC